MSRLALLSFPIALVACAVSEDAGTDDLGFADAAPADRLAAPISLTLEAGPGNAGQATVFTITGLAPMESVTLLRADSADLGDGPCSPAIGDQCVDILGRVRAVGTAMANASGVATVSFTPDASLPVGFERAFQAVAIRGAGGADSVVSNPARLRLSNGTARLRAVHASPDAPPVDIYANGGLLLANVPFGAQSGFLDVPAGTYDVDIRAAGADPASAPVFSATLALDASFTYNVIATGFLTSTDPADAFRVLPLVDDWGTLDPTSVRLRVVHGSPDAPAVGLDIGNDGTIEVPSLPRFAETGAAGVQLPADTTLPVGIVTTAGDKVTSFTAPALAPGEEAIVLAFGELGAHPSAGTGFSLLALLRSGAAATIRQDPVVYALHASPGAPAVDVLAGGAPLIEDLAFRDLSAPVQVPPGAYDLTVAVAANGASVATFTTPQLEAGNRYLVTATGFVGGTPAFQPLVSVDTFDREDMDGRIQLVHASPDAPAVDIGLDVQGSLDAIVTGVPFGAQTTGRGINVVPGSYDVGFAIAGDPNTLFAFPGVAIAPMDRAFYLATGSVGAGDFGVTIVDTTTAPWTTATAFPAN